MVLHARYGPGAPRRGRDHLWRCFDPFAQEHTAEADCGYCATSGAVLMISPSPAVRIVIATKPVDFRKGHDGLAALAERDLGHPDLEPRTSSSSRSGCVSWASRLGRCQAKRDQQQQLASSSPLLRTRPRAAFTPRKCFCPLSVQLITILSQSFNGCSPELGMRIS